MTEAALKKDRNEGQHCQHSGREGELCQVGADVGRFAEEGKVKHRSGLLALDENEKGEERSEEHTSELQSHSDLVCRLLLEKKKKHQIYQIALLRLLHDTSQAVTRTRT